MKLIELHFLPGEGAVVLDLAAARAGRIAYLGMRLDADAGGWVPSGEASRVVLAGDHAVTDAAALRKDVRVGHVVPADQATAEWAGVPWKPRGEPTKAAERPDALAPDHPDEAPAVPRVGPGRAEKGR